jgi:hypothetical protein
MRRGFASCCQKNGPAAKRAAVAHLQETMDPSERRACSIATSTGFVGKRGLRCANGGPGPGRGRSGADPGGSKAECALVAGFRL